MSPKVHPTHCTGLVSALRRVGRATAATGALLCCSWCGVAIAQSDDGNSATGVQVRVLIEALLDVAAPLTLREPQVDTVLQLLESGVETTTQVQVIVDVLDPATELTLTISVDNAEVVSVPSTPIAIVADGNAVRRRVQFELAARNLGETTVSLVVINSANGATVAERTMRVVVRELWQILSPLDGTQIALIRGNGTMASSQVEVVIVSQYAEFPVALSVQLDDAEPSPVFISTTSLALTESAAGDVRTRFTVAAAEAGNTTLTLVVIDRVGNRAAVMMRVSVERVKEEVCESCLIPDTVVVPAGSFTMGSSADDPFVVGEPFRYGNEVPQHQVRIDYAFAVGQYELTRGQYRAFVDASGHDAGSFWRNSSVQNDTHPAIFVSWGDAKAYLSWLSEQTGEEWRLLSEAEWEYAARAGTTTSYFFGPTIDAMQANYLAGRNGGTVAVGNYDPNTFGLYDMHGNVWELVGDCWHDAYTGAPTDGSAWLSACDRDDFTNEEDRVRRGGAWDSVFEDLRSAARGRYQVGVRINNMGFRVARTLNP